MRTFDCVAVGGARFAGVGRVNLVCDELDSWAGGRLAAIAAVVTLRVCHGREVSRFARGGRGRQFMAISSMLGLPRGRVRHLCD